MQRFLFVVLLFAPLSAMAGGFKVLPTVITLTEERPVSTLEVTSGSQRTVNFEVEAEAWMQSAEGKDVVAPAEGLKFFPKIFALGPGETKQVRVGYRGEPVEVERAYRLYVRELPIQRPDSSGVRIATRYGLPVYVEPADPEHAWQVTGAEIAAGQLHVLLTSTGTIHERIRDIRVQGVDVSGNAVGSFEAVGWSLLAGSTRRFAVNVPEEACAQLASVEVTAEDKRDVVRRASFAVDAANCSRSAVLSEAQ